MEIEISNTDKLLQTIELRKKELKETTKQAVSAIAVNTLKSLRADTKIANPNQNRIIIEESSLKVALSKKNNAWIIVNNIGQIVKVQDKVIPLVTPSKGIKPKLYHATNIISQEKELRYYVIALSQGEVKKTIKSIIKKVVDIHKGLAKTALGIAMAKIAAQSINDNVTNDTKILASNLNEVTITETGFDSGEVKIKIHDKLDYANKALKSGEGYITTAQNNAINKTLGMISQKLKKDGRISDSLAVKDLISKA